MKRTIIIALILIGFSATLAQILLMRELTIVFYGNELSLGVTLAGWLCWTGIGSSLLGYIADRVRNPVQLFVIIQILLPLIIGGETFLVRNIRHILGVAHGVTIGLAPMVVSCFLVFLPLCLLTGFLFTLGCKIYTEAKKEVAPQIGNVYIYDGLGDILAGILFTYLLVYFFHSFKLITYLFFLNLFSGLFILYYLPQQILLKAIILLLSLLSIFFFESDSLEQFSKKLQWQGYNLVMSRDSIYGNIAITKEENQYSFYENGLPIFTTPDKVSSEQLIHFPMAMHPDPKHILIMGKGVAGGLTELLKYPEISVHYVELDPMIIDLAKKYLPQEDLTTLKKCYIHLMDGRLFVKRTREKFDLIMVNLPDPATAQLNRFYTQEFFEEVKNILQPDGIFSTRIISNENYLSEELKKLNGCIYKTLKEVFKEVVIAPGDQLIFFASPRKDILTSKTEVLRQRFKAREIQTTYVDEYYFPYRLLQDRIAFVKKEISSYQGPANTDFYPIGYFYDMLLWSTQFNTAVRGFFNGMAKINLYWICGLLVVLILLHSLMSKKRPLFAQTAIPIAIMTTGYAGLSQEIILIFAFQVLYGYIYHRIGMIVASFMVGLVIGTLLMKWKLKKEMTDFEGIWLLAQIEFSIFLYSLLLPFIFIVIANLKSQASIFITVELLFPILTILAGIFVGLEFPLANKLYISDFHRLAKGAGLIYGFDLFGACLGGLLSTILFIPILGISQTSFICGLFNLASFSLVLRAIGFEPFAKSIESIK